MRPLLRRDVVVKVGLVGVGVGQKIGLELRLK